MNEEIIDDWAEQAPLKLANQQTRFAHLVIDTVTMYGLMFIGAMLLEEMGNDSLFGWVFITPFLLYPLLTEYFLGKTLGKLITKTHVVNIQGEPLGFFQALGRTLCRYIPFNAFSFLFSERGWHDRFSNTQVVKDDAR